MDCSICMEPCAKRVLCAACGSLTCHSCLTEYAIPACPACQQPFTKVFLQSSGSSGKQLVKTVYKPHHETVLWDREKALLPKTQALVDWEIEAEALKKRLRFGEAIKIPKKPNLTLSSQSVIFPCPASDCRGFVQSTIASNSVVQTKCASCKKEVCNKCREFDGQAHTCDPAVLQSLEAIAQDSKPCPKCTANIFRTQGCNHMFCTNCRTHFDYISGKILVNSSNHHYDRTQRFAENIATLSGRVASDSACEANPMHDSVPRVPQSARTSIFYRMLYEEAQTTRFLLQSMFGMDKLIAAHQETLIQIRINYLRKKLSEEDAKSKVYLAEQQFEKKCHYHRLLHNLLVAMNDMQRIWKEIDFPTSVTSSREAETLLQLIRNTVTICQETSQAIQTEYGGAELVFNVDFETDKRPLVSF